MWKSAKRTNSTHLTAEEELELVRKVQNDNCNKSLTIIINKFNDMVYSYARRGAPDSDFVSDAAQEARIGIIRAVKKFDTNSGNRLSTYLHSHVAETIKHFRIQSSNTVIHNKTHPTLKAYYELCRVIGTELCPDYNSITTKVIKHVAEKTGESEANVILAANSLICTNLTHTPYGDDIFDVLPGDDNTYTVEGRIKADINNTIIERHIHEAINSLNPRTAEIIRSRYLEDTPVKLEVLAEKFGITHQRVDQIAKDGIKQLHKYFVRNDIEYNF